MLRELEIMSNLVDRKEKETIEKMQPKKASEVSEKADESGSEEETKEEETKEADKESDSSQDEHHADIQQEAHEYGKEILKAEAAIASEASQVEDVKSIVDQKKEEGKTQA